MKIGFDGKRAVNNMTGLGNYSRLIIESLAREYPADEMLVYAPRQRSNARIDRVLAMGNVTLRLPERAPLGGSVWRTWGVTGQLRRDGVTLYHGLSNELPLIIANSGVPSVVTIHDVIYRRIKECYNAIDRLTYDYKYGRSCHNATRIIAISERTRDDIVELYKVDPAKIDIVYQGCDSQFDKLLTSGELERTRRELNLPPRYILQVGTIEMRKNLELTVRALSALPQDVTLVVVGRNRKGYKERVEAIARELGVIERVIFRDDVAFDRLPAVYQLAEASVYPSLYEGFGIPVIESLTSGCPTVAATGSCLEEAGGDAAMYVNPHDVHALADALNAILDGAVSRDELARRGREYVKRFDNSTMARRIMAVYDKALSEYRVNRV